LTQKSSPIQQALDEAAWLTATLPIRLAGDPALSKRCQPVTGDELDSGQAKKWAEQMIHFLTTYRRHTGVGRGLAANQLGIPKQMILILLDSGPQIFLNPNVMESEGEGVYPESCISYASLISGDVKRPWTVKIEYSDLKGDRQETTMEPLQSRIMLHEIDHLHGQLCSDRYEPGTIRINDGDPDKIVNAELKRIR
jgi:peptide deformylase